MKISIMKLMMTISLTASISLVSAYTNESTPNNQVKPKINHIIVFGDSLSDDGNLYKKTLGIEPNSSDYFHGRFTSAPGNWVDYLQNIYNQQAIISNNQSKTGFIVDYATGGATAYSYSQLPISLKTFTDLKYDVATKIVGDINQQVLTYLKQYDKQDKSKSLAVIFAGANDFLWLGAWAQGTENLANANYNTIETRAIEGVKNAINLLEKNGISNFIIVGLPDISKTPEFINGNYSLTTKQTIHNAIEKYNNDLQQLAINSNTDKIVFFCS